MNKRRQRTEELHRVLKERAVSEYVVNTLEQHNFDNLVRRGIIVEKYSVVSIGASQRP